MNQDADSCHVNCICVKQARVLHLYTAGSVSSSMLPIDAH